MVGDNLSKAFRIMPTHGQDRPDSLGDSVLKLLCWAHDMQAVVRRAVKGKHAGEYKLACGCWRGATMPDSRLTEVAT